MRKKTHPFHQVSHQARTIIGLFGGPSKLARCTRRLAELKNDQSLVRHRVTIHRWMLPNNGHDGTGGLIPTSALPIVLACARLEGIVIKSEHLYGEPAA